MAAFTTRHRLNARMQRLVENALVLATDEPTALVVALLDSLDSEYEVESYRSFG